MVNSIQSVSLAAAGNGIGLVAPSAGNSQMPVLAVKSLIAGPGILIGNTTDATVTISATGMPPLTSLITASAHWAGTNTTPSILPIFIAAFPLVVTAIYARIEQISSSAGTLKIVKSASTVALSAGTSLLVSPFDVTSTAHLAQDLPLVDDVTVLTLEPGDSLGMTTTGTWTNAYGGLTIHMAPWYAGYPS